MYLYIMCCIPFYSKCYAESKYVIIVYVWTRTAGQKVKINSDFQFFTEIDLSRGQPRNRGQGVVQT